MDYAPLLVVEPDANARNLMLGGLRAAGVPALGAASAYDALTWCEELVPGLVVSEATLPDAKGAELVRRLRADDPTRSVPFFFLTGSGDLDLDAVEAMGAQDVLAKPAFVRDVVSLARLHGGRPAGVPVVDGRLEELGLPHLLRLLATGRRSGRVVLPDHGGEIRFRAGRIVAATRGEHGGEGALMRLLTFTRGAFHVCYEPVPDEGGLSMTVDTLFARGFTHVRTWEQVSGTIGPLDRPMVVDYRTLGARLGELPDAVNEVVRAFDGDRTVDGVIDASSLGDLTTLRVVAKLDRMGILRAPGEAAPTPEGRPTATDRLLEGLFGSAGLPAGAGAVAAPVPALPDWTEGRDAEWDAILPDLPEDADPWVALRQTEATLADLAAVPAPDLDGVGETPIDRPQTAAATFDHADEAFFARPATHDTETTRRATLPLFGLVLLAVAIAAVAVAVGMAQGTPAAHARTKAPVKAMVLPAMRATPAPAAKPAPAVKAAPAVRAAPAAKPAPAVKPAPAAKPAADLTHLLDAGQKAYGAGHLAAAARLYRKAIAAAPKNAVARLGLGLALLDGGHTKDAIASIEKARALDPTSARGAVLLGSAYQLDGNRPAAAKAYRDYLRLAPDGAQAKDVKAILAGWAKH